MFCCKVVEVPHNLVYCYTLSRFPDSFNVSCTFTLIQNNKILVKIVNKQENISKLQSNDVIQYVKVVRCNEGRTIKVLVWDHVTFLQSVVL